MVTMPVPMSMLTDFWDWARRQPESAVKELDTQRPTVVVKAGLMDEERTMSGLLPVARMARPSRVRRKSERKTITRTTAMSATRSLYCPERGVSFRKALALVKTVSVLFMLRREELPMTAMLME